MSAQNITSNDHLNSALSTLTSLVYNNFKCSIYLDTFADPHVIPECLHRFCGACVKESIRKCGAERPKCRARITTKRGLRKDNDFQDMVSLAFSDEY
jgi:E3 ubiquitin-protein ligase RNF1/2